MVKLRVLLKEYSFFFEVGDIMKNLDSNLITYVIPISNLDDIEFRMFYDYNRYCELVPKLHIPLNKNALRLDRIAGIMNKLYCR